MEPSILPPLSALDLVLSQLKDTLHETGCSLVLQNAGVGRRLFYKKGVRDLEDLLDHEPETLHGAVLADKVVGKAAAGMMALGGVRAIYAEVLSRKAIPLLEEHRVAYTCGTLVDQIVIPKGDDRCPLEKIVDPATTAEETVDLLRRHFKEMQG